MQYEETPQKWEQRLFISRGASAKGEACFHPLYLLFLNVGEYVDLIVTLYAYDIHVVIYKQMHSCSNCIPEQIPNFHPVLKPSINPCI